MDQQFQQWIEQGAMPGQFPVGAAHAAIGAVFAAIIGYLDDTTEEDLSAKMSSRCFDGAFVKTTLSPAAGM